LFYNAVVFLALDRHDLPLLPLQAGHGLFTGPNFAAGQLFLPLSFRFEIRRNVGQGRGGEIAQISVLKQS
jgi:hypothetical protein